jgi:hypothetical protein
MFVCIFVCVYVIPLNLQGSFIIKDILFLKKNACFPQSSMRKKKSLIFSEDLPNDMVRDLSIDKKDLVWSFLPCLLIGRNPSSFPLLLILSLQQN